VKNVVVTGAGGFMGRSLINTLLRQGVHVYALDLLGGQITLPANEKICFIPMKEGSFEGVADQMKQIEIDTFYHLAWAGVSTTHKNDFILQSSNINLTLKAMELAGKLGAKKIICPGSTSEYAYCGQTVNGHNLPAPADMYAACKLATYFTAQLFAKQHNLPLIWLLIASTYGPGRNDNNIITYSINTLLDGKKPSYTQLEQKWDYLYIDDLISALYLVGEKGIPGSTYPIGSGIAKSLAEYIIILRNKIDPNLPLGIGEIPYKTAQIDHSIVDISLLQAHTGFKPLVSFEEGILRTISYYREKRG